MRKWKNTGYSGESTDKARTYQIVISRCDRRSKSSTVFLEHQYMVTCDLIVYKYRIECLRKSC